MHTPTFLFCHWELSFTEQQQQQQQPQQQQQALVVLKDRRVMGPTFQMGDVRCHDITNTSVRVSWPKSTNKKHPAIAYRVCTAEVGDGFEVCRFGVSYLSVFRSDLRFDPGSCQNFIS